MQRYFLPVAIAFSAATFIASYSLAAATECGDLDNSGKIAATDALLLLNTAVGQPVTPLSCPVEGRVLATGQTTCYAPNGEEIDCTGTGQDGELQLGAARSFTDNGDGTITDAATGLMWEKHSDDGSIHDKDRAYSVDEMFPFKLAALNSTSFAGYDDWRLPNVAELETLRNFGAANPATYPDFNTNCAPGCTVTTCSCTVPAFYLSSTSSSQLPQFVFTVFFADGSIMKDVGSRVRAVRGGHAAATPAVTANASTGVCGDLDNSGTIAATDALLLLNTAVGQPVPPLACPIEGRVLATGQTTCYANAQQIDCVGTGQDGELQLGAARSFTDNGDGTITDKTTGLMWEKHSDDDSLHDKDDQYSPASQKISSLNSTTFAGHDDWRLPNVTELETLRNFGAVNPATYSAFDTNCVPGCTVTTCSCTVSDFYISSTKSFAFTGSGFSVYFADGSVLVEGGGFVRGVRGGR